MSKVQGDKAGADSRETGAPQGRDATQPDHVDDVALPEQFGRFRIVRKLGEGGMGAVFLAEDTRLQNRRVAIKIPKLDGPSAREDLDRFLREAGIAATLSHPNLCPVFDVDVIDRRHYIAMAYVEGQSLSRVIEAKRQSVRAVVSIVRKIALAVHEAHRHGIIHRDLKPANVMIDTRKEPVVMDFGLARQTGPQNERITRSGTILGSPAYMPKEQVLGEADRMGPHTDVYSLGVMLFEMLTGRLPFQGPNISAVLAKIMTEEPPSPSSLRPEVDPQLEAIVRKAMAREIADRYPTMSEFAAALAGWLKQGATVAEELTLAHGSSPAVRPIENPTEEQLDSGRSLPGPARGRSKRRWIAVAGVLGLLAVAALVWGARRAAAPDSGPQGNSGSGEGASADGQAESGESVPSNAGDPEMSETDEGEESTTDGRKSEHLMAKILLPRHVLSGSWKRTRKSFLAEGEADKQRQRYTLAVPVEVPADYRFELSFIPTTTEQKAVCVGFLVAGRPVTVFVDKLGVTSGLEQVDGKLAGKNETTREGALLTPQKSAHLVITVRGSHVVVTVDDKPVIDWEGDPERLTQSQSWPEATPQRLTIGAFMPIRIHRVRIERLK